MSRASSEGLLANSVAYVGRASFRIEEVPEDDEGAGNVESIDPLVTARIGMRAPVHFEAPAPPEPVMIPWRRPRLVLPAWALGGLSLAAFAVGLFVSAAIAHPLRAQSAAVATTAELGPPAPAAPIAPVIEQLR